MWKRLLIICAFILFVALSLLVSSCFLSASYASSPAASQSEGVTLTLDEYNQLSDNLTKLRNNSQTQQQRISQLETLLQTSSTATDESATSLVKAQKQTAEQAQQLQKLNTLLKMQNEQLTKTQLSLQTANASLQQLEQELKQRKNESDRNRTIAIVASVAALYFAAR